MLLQPPIPSVKASKKLKSKKNKDQIKKQKNGTMKKAPVNSLLGCSDIKKAKMCKTNSKCVYDYVEFKCKDKPNSPVNMPVSKKSNRNSQKLKKQKELPNKKITKENETKSILQQLRKSFKKIGNEALKDSNLLAKAEERI